MNSRGATRPLGDTLFKVRDIVNDKLDENIPQNPTIVLKSSSHVNEKSV